MAAMVFIIKYLSTTVTTVWICAPNYHKILVTLALNFSRFIDHLRSHIKHSKACFIRCLNTSKSFEKKKKTRLRVFFSTYYLLSVWISDETCFRVFDIASQVSNNYFSCLVYYLQSLLKVPSAYQYL